MTPAPQASYHVKDLYKHHKAPVTSVDPLLVHISALLLKIAGSES